MSDDQISLPYFAAILIILGFIVRYLFFNGAGTSPAQTPRSPEALLRARETAVERIQQMFPQTDRRTILWDLHRNGMNIQNTTERILAGRLETVSSADYESSRHYLLILNDSASYYLPAPSAKHHERELIGSAPQSREAVTARPHHALQSG